jgi:hypothetical protein
MLLVIILRRTIKDNPHSKQKAKIRNLKGVIPGANNGELGTNIATTMLFLALGYILEYSTGNAVLKNGAGLSIQNVNTIIDSVTEDTVWTMIKEKYRHFDTNEKYLQDHMYFVHCMEKPAFEVPNPVILGTFLGEQTIPQSLTTDPEATEMLDRNRHHDFAYQIVKYFHGDGEYPEQRQAMKDLIEHIFKLYQNDASYLWTSNNKIPASTYMQNSTTELPSLAYHGNLYIDRPNGREEVRCVGQLGNSFPGCACIRQGKGMLNMYERPPTAIHVI